MEDDAGVSVLVVDDDALELAAIEAILAPLARCVCVQSGVEAIEALAAAEFAAVLLDVGMPVLDGFETAQLIKERPASRHVPIIFLTGRIGEAEVRRGYAVGAVDYLLKPFEPEILQAKVNVFVDLARLRRETAALSHRALHDQLTGLPNRTLFLNRLELALARIAREPALVTVFFLDLDGFKDVNDRLGHCAGDRLLTETAARLQAAIRATDTAARFAGDEFLVLCEQLHDEDEVEQLAVRIREVFAAPFAAGGELVPLGACIGVATTDDPATAPEDAIREADEDMLRAKAIERGAFARTRR